MVALLMPAKHILDTALGTPNIRTAPPQTGSFAQLWRNGREVRSICENQVFAILHRMQTGKSALIKKDGGEMLVAIVLHRPLCTGACWRPTEVAEILQIIQDKQSHPVIEGMVKADVRDEMPASEFALASASSFFLGRSGFVPAAWPCRSFCLGPQCRSLSGRHCCKQSL